MPSTVYFRPCLRLLISYVVECLYQMIDHEKFASLCDFQEKDSVVKRNYSWSSMWYMMCLLTSSTSVNKHRSSADLKNSRKNDVWVAWDCIRTHAAAGSNVWQAETTKEWVFLLNTKA